MYDDEGKDIVDGPDHPAFLLGSGTDYHLLVLAMYFPSDVVIAQRCVADIELLLT